MAKPEPGAMETAKSILIVGGGIIGLSTAYHAVLHGHRVTIVERGAPGHDACSMGNAGMVVPSHFVPLAAPGMVAVGLRMMMSRESPFYIRPRLSLELLDWCRRFVRAATPAHVGRCGPILRDLHLASRRCFEDLAALHGADFGLTKKGLLMLCRSPRTLEEEAHVAEEACKLGIPAEVLSPEATSRLDPGVRMDVAGSVYFPLDCHLAPERLVALLTRELEKAGVTFHWSTELVGWRHGAGRITAAATSRGELSADEFVVAAGSWSSQAVRSLGLRLPLQAGKGYSLTIPAPRRLPGICSILTEARVAVTPMGSSLRFAGTLEIAGLDETVDPARVRGIIKAIPSYFPEFTADDFRGVPVWCGLRPCSPDGLPYIGRVRRFSNLSMATGHGMMGISLGPITGKLVAEILSGEPPCIDTTPLSPDRHER